MSAPVIGFAGMTHLGVVSAAAAMARGFSVVCYDEDSALIDALSKGRPPVSEPGLEEILRDRAGSARFTTHATELNRCAVIYISTDVATDDEGQSDLSQVTSLIATVIGELSGDAVLVILCQVPPSFTRGIALAQERLFYQVETLVFGRAVDRALHPERFIVGCANPEAPLPRAYQAFLDAFGCPVLPMRYESAELAKIAINCCLVATLSAANTLAEICERMGAVWSEIAPALKLDRRIGPYAYLSPGLGIAGGNLERDLATVIRLADALHTDAVVVKAWIANSRHRRDWAARTIRALLLDARPRAVLAIWGLAYKENTSSVKNSPSLSTIAQLPATALRLHDPVVPAAAAHHARAVAAADPLQALEGADALLILTPWPQYREIAPARIAAALRGRIVLDPYGVLDANSALAAGLEIHTLGRSAKTAGHA